MIKRLHNIAISLFIATLAATIYSSQSSAVAVIGFEAGNIIDDAVFTNTSSMAVDQIQTFLNSKVPICDSWGTNGTTSTSRANYIKSIGETLPLTCLKDYVENGKTSAQIIYDVAQEYKINPQVLIVLLQKEQALITDDWPVSGQYRSATGYGCPDDAPCNTDYYGFTNQVRWAARMFRAILNDSPTWYTPYELGNNYIQYNPSSSCGGTTVNIQNRATQGLYNYTPYQPNEAALSAGYGTGNGCSAYGNRNFYLYFTDWFGSTHAVNGTISLSKPLMIDAVNSTATIGDKVTASFEVSNSADYEIDAGGLGICARIEGENYDFGFIGHNTVPANNKITISLSRTLNRAGSLSVFICSYNDLLGGWANSKYPYNIDGLQTTATLQVKDNPLITTGVTFNPASPAVGQPVTASFTITNSNSNPITINRPILVARDPNGANADFGVDEIITIPGNSTYTYSKTRTFTVPGAYKYFISNLSGENTWNINYPKSTGNDIVRAGTLQVKDNPLITTGVTFNPASPAVGQPVTASFTITNASSSPITINRPILVMRDPNGANADFSIDEIITIPGNSTYTYSKSRAFTMAGTYSYFISNLSNNGIWDANYPKNDNMGIIRSGTIQIK